MVEFTNRQALRQLRVALLTNSLSPHTLPLCEGISASVADFCAFVSAAKDDFHGFPAPQASFPIVVQKSLNALRLRYRTNRVNISESLHIPVDTLPQLLRFRPDVILSSQFGARTLFAILYCLLRPRAKLILWAALSAHTEQSRSRVRALFRRWMLRHADAAFTNGQSGANYLRGLGFTRSITAIPYTIDDTLFRTDTYQVTPGKRHLLFCGRIDQVKGTLRFFQLLCRWCEQHPDRLIHFDLIGGGPDSDTIFAAPLPENLTLTIRPRLSQAELAAHYHEADLFIFPSLFDEWGVVINEAMSAGLPVLGSIYSQAVTELVQPGQIGWLYDPHNPDDSLTQLNLALTAKPEQLLTMSANARAAAQAIAPDRIIARALDAIAEVTGTPNPESANATQPALVAAP